METIDPIAERCAEVARRLDHLEPLLVDLSKKYLALVTAVMAAASASAAAGDKHAFDDNVDMIFLSEPVASVQARLRFFGLLPPRNPLADLADLT